MCFLSGVRAAEPDSQRARERNERARLQAACGSFTGQPGVSPGASRPLGFLTHKLGTMLGCFYKILQSLHFPTHQVEWMMSTLKTWREIELTIGRDLWIPG